MADTPLRRSRKVLHIQYGHGVLNMIHFSEKLLFASWRTDSIPVVATGVYAIWEGDTLLYCGMSGRSFEPRNLPPKKKYGLVTRLSSHASGRLSGDSSMVSEGVTERGLEESTSNRLIESAHLRMAL